MENKYQEVEYPPLYRTWDTEWKQIFELGIESAYKVMPPATVPTVPCEFERNIKKLAGHIANGTNTTVRIFQDDATKEWVASVGSSMMDRKFAYGGTMAEAVLKLADQFDCDSNFVNPTKRNGGAEA